MAEQVCQMLGEHLASALWDSTGDSKSLSLVVHTVAAAEHSVGLVVYLRSLITNNIEDSVPFSPPG